MTQASANPGTGSLKLPATLDLPAARDLLDALRKAESGAAPITLDASAIEALSVPYLQILVSAMASPGISGISNPSSAFSGAFADLGLSWKEAPASTADIAQAAAPAAAETIQPSEPPDDAACDAPALAKRILTIDDSKTMRDMLMLTLSSSGFDVIQAVDGQDGIDVLRNESVDIVITDINMPKMDGYGVIQHLRGNPAFDGTPILVLTTESDREKKERARELGATGFIVKPFNPVSLVEVIRKVCVN